MRNGVLAQITDLERLSRDELHERWRALIGGDPPRYSRDLLVGRLAYRIQELAYGGLPESVEVRLDECLPEDGIDSASGAAARLKRSQRKNGMPVAGTRLIREWQGQRYEVTVVDGGFEYGGRRYRSLTAITKAITGTHWNGPAFFGLRKPERKKEA